MTIIIFIAAQLVCQTTLAGDIAQTRNVLIIYSYDDALPWQRRVRHGLQARLAERSGTSPVRLFEERIDSIRLKRPYHEPAWSDYLTQKYDKTQIDIVLTEGEDAAHLLVTHPSLFMNAKRFIVNPGGVRPGPQNETSIVAAEDYERVIGTVVGVRPQAGRLVVIGDLNSSRIERLRIEGLRSAWEKHFAQKIKFEVWANDFTFEELYERVRHLPDDAVVVYALLTRDRTGARAAPYTILQNITAQAAVPVFATHDSLIGSGTVGGYLLSGERVGWAMSALIQGTDPSSLDNAFFSANQFDSRALSRWGIPDSLLPLGAVINFRDPSFWERNASIILYGAPLFLFETLILIFLVRALHARRIAINALRCNEQKLFELNADLEVRVEERTHELTMAAESAQISKMRAEDAFEQLMATQEQLIQVEKLASLGSLVSGVAHEINTPIGVSITCASHIAEQINELSQKISSRSLRKSDLDNFISQAHESAGLLVGNLMRAADLIQSFKQVSVDVSSDMMRKFDLCQCLADTAHNFSPVYKKLGHTVEIISDGPVMMFSYPGAVAQIITNLLSNSICHGFDKNKQGTVVIKVSRCGDEDVEVSYSDNGRGIPSQLIGKVFDPFFTTKRGDGSTGLGLHIVYNLVTSSLQGKILLRSEEGHGVNFLMRFPIHSEHSNEQSDEAQVEDSYPQGQPRG